MRNMKVLMVNGSAHQKGNTFLSLEEVGKALKEEGIDYEIFQLGGGPIRDCIGCGQCAQYCAWNAIAQPAGEKGGVA